MCVAKPLHITNSTDKTHSLSYPIWMSVSRTGRESKKKPWKGSSAECPLTVILNATYSFCMHRCLYSSLLIYWLIPYSISLYLAEKCDCTLYTQVSQRMREQTNENTEHIPNVIKRWKWGEDKHSVGNEKGSGTEWLERVVLSFALYNMEINFDSRISIWLTFGRIWTVDIFLAVSLIKPRYNQ